MAEREQIVFVNEDGTPTGEYGPKLASHHSQTRRHLAFSCYAFDANNQLLVTERAHDKLVWPGVKTNSFCGHPGPGEGFDQAVPRRGRYELGLEIGELALILPDYRYTSPPFGKQGIIENEFCPVFFARALTEPQPNPDEVAAAWWMGWEDYQQALAANPDDWSYWAKDQLPHLLASEEAQVWLARDWHA